MLLWGAREQWVLVAIVSCALLAVPASVSGQTTSRDRSIVEFDFNRTPVAGNRLGENWRFGGLFELDAIADRDLELSPDFEEDTATLEPRLDLALAYRPSAQLTAFAQVELSRLIFLENEFGFEEPEVQLNVEQAFVSFAEIVPGLTLQVGRQLFEDERDWWYKEELDALRLFYRTERFGLEFSVSRSDLVGRDVLNDDEPERTTNFFLIGRYAYQEDAELDAYVFKQDGRVEENPEDDPDVHEEDPWFFGFRSIGELGSSDFEHWLDFSIVRGKDDGRDIRAYGFDAGLTYEPDLRYDSLFTLGVALGSGDDKPFDGVDREFRQTGFQESFYYYGEVLAPELSNLWVYTAGASMYVTDDLSAGFLYHYYRQRRASRRAFRDAFIFQNPNGVNKNLGQALDLVVSYYGSGGLYADVIFGTFFPGDAFRDNSPNAYFGEIIIGHEF